jgi:uncharacterized protein (TIGR00255 family)
MTGFGRSEGVVNDRKVTIELRSLNSKQLDLFLKIPSLYKEHEAELRQWVGDRVVRGKAELVIVCERTQGRARTSIDRELLRSYLVELKDLAHDLAPDSTTDLFAMALRMPEVTQPPVEKLEGSEWDSVSALVQKAMEAYDGFRKSEGERLLTELRSRVDGISSLLAEVTVLDADRTDRTRERIKAKLAELEVQVDQARFEQELVYYLEKMDVTEEKVRLASHCTYFKETLAADEPQGRKLGFIAQEMGREINTLGSKANDAALQRLVVHMKDELEKIKEQVLNIL